MANSILQSNPKAGYLAHQGEIDAAVQKTLAGGWYILGQEVAAFEREFAEFLGIGHAVGVGNGTDAIELALRACGIGAGDAVVTVSHTAVATVSAIERAGATPVLVDIDPTTFTISTSGLETALRSSLAPVKAVIPVHLYGHAADMLAVTDIARRHQLRVIEDCAQCHGATLNGRMTGTWGDLAAFSFYPTKNLGALGDGGAVATNDAALAERLRWLREYGWRERYISSIAGLNTRLDELQAAILRVRLKYLSAENARRREIAAAYSRALEEKKLSLPKVKAGVEHVFHQYVVRTPNRDALRERLKDQGIGTLVHYPQPVHLQPAYAGRVRLGPGGLPETESAAREILSLPMYPQLSDDEVARVAEAVCRWCDEQPVPA